MSSEGNGRPQNVYAATETSTGGGLDTAALGPRFLRGDVLANRFEIVRFLARGGMGEVYEAQDRLLQNSRVALKTILPKSALEPEARLRLKKEVMLAREVTHPNVCPIYDLFECEQPQSTCFLTMKLVSGETLGQRLRRPPAISLREALLIVRQLCGALRAAHAAGVVHRDLKPGNIMLQGTAATLKAIVTDFGIALEYEPDRTVSINAHLVGTPGYIAPEVLAGEPATPASDLYALGVVLHEIFTGDKPANMSGEAVFRPTETQNKDIPPWCLRLITGCLDKAPETRMREFQRVIEYLGLDETVPAEKLQKYRMSRRKLLGIGAAATAAVAGAVLWRDDAWENILHPLPRRRFVAVIGFPPPSDPRVKPLVQGVIDAIETELSRAEAFDRDLYVMAPSVHGAAELPTLHHVRDSSGANLALTARGSLSGDRFHVLLQVLDSTTSAILRVRQIVTSEVEIQSSVRRAVVAAADLLDVRLRRSSTEQPSFATSSEQAYKSFQTAEDLMKQPNDAGLDKAMDNYRAALEADPKYAIAYARLAKAFCRYFSLHGDPAALELARRNAEKGLKLNPNLIEGHTALSSYYDYDGVKDKALDEIATALALDPTNARTLYFQAQIYWRMNRRSDAEEIYHRILEQRPNYWLAYNELGCVLEEQGRYREALAKFRSETLVNPRTYLGFANVGDIYFKLGDSEQARQNYEKSLDRSPNEYAFAGMGALLRAAGNYGGALPYQLKATQISPSDDVNWLNLGDCYQSLHKEKQARDAYLRAKKEVEGVLALDAENFSAWFRLALYNLETNQPGDQLKLLAKAAQPDSLDLDTQVIEARIYELLGERQQAMAVLGKCFAKGLTNIEIAYIPDFQALKKDPAFAKLISGR